MSFDRTFLDPLLTAPTPAPGLSAGAFAGGRGKGEETDPTHQAALQFEAVFLSQMMAPMFESLDSGGLFGGGPGERICRSLMVREYASAIARSDGIGIADAVEREFLKLQEVES